MKKLVTVLILSGGCRRRRVLLLHVRQDVEKPQIMQGRRSREGDIVEVSPGHGHPRGDAHGGRRPAGVGPVTKLGADFNDIVTPARWSPRSTRRSSRRRSRFSRPTSSGRRRTSRVSACSSRTRKRTLTRTKELFDKGLANQTAGRAGRTGGQDPRGADCLGREVDRAGARPTWRRPSSTSRYTEVKSPIDGVVVDRKRRRRADGAVEHERHAVLPRSRRPHAR